MSSAGERILRSARSARAYARGEVTEGFVLHVPTQVDVRAVRQSTGLSQVKFARHFGFSPAAVRDWEQGRRQPEAPARLLLLLIQRRRDAVEEVLGSLAAA